MCLKCMDYTELYNRVYQDTGIGVISMVKDAPKMAKKIHRYGNYSEYRYRETLPYSISEFSVAYFDFDIF